MKQAAQKIKQDAMSSSLPTNTQHDKALFKAGAIAVAVITAAVTMQSCTANAATFDFGDLVIEVEHTTEMQAGVYGGSPYDDGVGAVCEITSTTVYDETGSVAPANISSAAFNAMETAITKWVEK